MAIDTPLKRFSALNVMSPWRGVLPLPDGAIAARDRQIVPFLYSGILATAPAAIATLTGTLVTTGTEGEIRAGGETIIVTLMNDTWVASGASFNAIRQDLIDGFVSAQAEVAGWNAIVLTGLPVTAVARTSDTVVTITLPDFPGYDITATETITGTIPASALTSAVALLATPTFTITVVQPPVTVTEDTHDGGKRKAKRFRDENEARKADVLKAFARVTGIELAPETPAAEVVQAVEQAVIKPKRPPEKALLREARALKTFLTTMDRAEEARRVREAEEEDFIVMTLLNRRLH